MFGGKAVGVFGGIEAPLRVRHVTPNVRQGVLCDSGIELVTRRLRGFEIREDQLRLVVQHLLEVRDTPVAIDRVSMKAAADVVAHASESHRPKRFGRHQQRRLGWPPQELPARVLPQKEQQLARSWEFRGVAKTAAAAIERSLE